MFRISFMVEDRKLAPVLKALSGNVHNMEPPMPVVVPEDDENPSFVKPHSTSIISLPPRRIPHNRGKSRLTSIQLPDGDLRARDIKALLPTVGISENSISNCLTQLVKARIIKKVRQGHYRKVDQ